MNSPADPRPAVLLGWVVLGGAIGVAARAALLLLVEDGAPTAVATLIVNVAGSFLLGVVVGCLGSGSPRVRAFLGTGVLGGFTTYSAFAVQVIAVADGSAPLALMLAVAALGLGVAGAVAGLVLGRRIAPGGRPEVSPVDAE